GFSADALLRLTVPDRCRDGATGSAARPHHWGGAGDPAALSGPVTDCHPCEPRPAGPGRVRSMGRVTAGQRPPGPGGEPVTPDPDRPRAAASLVTDDRAGLPGDGGRDAVRRWPEWRGGAGSALADPERQ